jgi:hypothetical protein
MDHVARSTRHTAATLGITARPAAPHAQPAVDYCETVHKNIGTAWTGRFGETANVDYYLSFADQGKQTYVFHFMYINIYY